MLTQDKKIIIGCLGNSLTDGYPGYSNYNGYGADTQSCYQYRIRELMQRDLDAQPAIKGAGIEFINRGICGEITEQIKKRFYPELIHHSLDKLGKKPDIIIIIGGTNDLGWGIDTNAIVGNIIDMHNSCKVEGIVSLGATIPPTRFEYDSNYNSRKMSINKELRRFFSSNEIMFADLYAKMGDASNNGNLKPALDAGDGLHFSVTGYKRMGEVIYEDGLKGKLFNSQ